MEEKKEQDSIELDANISKWNVCNVSEWLSIKSDLKENFEKRLHFIPTVGSAIYDKHIVHRHHWGLNPWSKALPETSDKLFTDICTKVDTIYQKMIDDEWNPGRRIFSIECDQYVWTNALFPIENLCSDAVFLTHRDVSNERINWWKWQPILCVIIWPWDMPRTKLIHVIMWPYGQSWDAWIYTMIFGSEWMPFPRDLDDDAPLKEKEYNEECKSFWEDHVFLITPEELENIIRLKREGWLSTKVEEDALLKFYEWNGKSPIEKDFIPIPSETSIRLSLEN